MVDGRNAEHREQIAHYPAGNFVEYYSDLDVIVDEEVWKVRASSGVETLAVWGPPLPTSFLMPEDLLG